MDSHSFPVRAAVVVATVGALAFGAAQVAGAGSLASTYADPAGDNGSAPDITAVQVSDDASGQITFQIQTPGTSALGGDQAILLGIDADQNATTGVNGLDYVFGVGASGYDFGRWNGSDWDWTTPYTTVRVVFAGGALISVNRNELGGASGLAFCVRAVAGDANVGQFDDAPDSGTWSYTLSGATPPAETTPPAPPPPPPAAPAPPAAPVPNPPPPKVTIAALIVPVRSMRPQAGKTFRFVVSSVRLGTGAIVAPTTATCTATLAGVRLRGTGRGGATWLLPKSARGKRLVVSVRVTYKTAAFSQKFVLRVV
jgi:hypothetical protein